MILLLKKAMTRSRFDVWHFYYIVCRFDRLDHLYHIGDDMTSYPTPDPFAITFEYRERSDTGTKKLDIVRFDSATPDPQAKILPPTTTTVAHLFLVWEFLFHRLVALGIFPPDDRRTHRIAEAIGETKAYIYSRETNAR